MLTDQRYPHLGGNVLGGDPRTYCPRLWRWLVETFRIRTVLDVGCGEGHAMAGFKALGCRVIGLDGLPFNVEASSRIGPTILCDLTRQACPLVGIDLVWCSELVEHVAESAIDNLLDTICCGRVLAMTHAIPGQSGYHHVNCQQNTYWIKRVIDRGFVHRWQATDESRSMGGPFWEQSGLIFERM